MPTKVNGDNLKKVFETATVRDKAVTRGYGQVWDLRRYGKRQVRYKVPYGPYCNTPAITKKTYSQCQG